jgi:hypothetical protein
LRRVIKAHEIKQGMTLLYPDNEFQVRDISPTRGLTVEVLLRTLDDIYMWWEFELSEPVTVAT